MLGRLGAMRIVYILPSRSGLTPSPIERNNVHVAPNYYLVHWCLIDVQWVVFTE